MDDDDPAAGSGLTFSGGKQSRSRTNSMACFLKSDSTTSENSDKLHTVPSPKGGLVKLAVSGLRKFRPFLKIKAALKKKPKKQQIGASNSASKKQVSSGYEHEQKLEALSEKEATKKNSEVAFNLEDSMKQAKPHRRQLEDERDRLVETEELSSTENAYSKAAANSCREENNSKVPEPEYKQGTEMESLALGNPKVDAMHDLNNQVDEDPNDGSVVYKSQSQTDKFAEKRPCHEHTNNLAIEAAKTSSKDLEYLKNQAHVKVDQKLYDNDKIEKLIKVEVIEDESNVLCNETNEAKQSVEDPINEANEAKVVENPTNESVFRNQSYTEPAASRFENEPSAWVPTEPLGDLPAVGNPPNQSVKNPRVESLSTKQSLEPLNLEVCKNHANAESPRKKIGGKLNCQSDKSAEVKFLADWKMVKPKQTNEFFYEAGDNLREEASQEGIVEMGKENRGSTAKTTPCLVKDNARSTRQSGFPENKSAIHDFSLGIPYGFLVIAESLLWFIATWRISSFYSGVLLGGLILASSISSLKAWSEGCSSRTHIKAQAAIAFLICARALPDVLKPKLLFPNAMVCILSAAMIGFYAYVYFFGNNVHEEKN